MCNIYIYNLINCVWFLPIVEDLERNDGSAERPYFMNSNLRRLLGKGDMFFTQL